MPTVKLSFLFLFFVNCDIEMQIAVSCAVDFQSCRVFLGIPDSPATAARAGRKGQLPLRACRKLSINHSYCHPGFYCYAYQILTKNNILSA